MRPGDAEDSGARVRRRVRRGWGALIDWWILVEHRGHHYWYRIPPLLFLSLCKTPCASAQVLFPSEPFNRGIDRLVLVAADVDGFPLSL